MQNQLYLELLKKVLIDLHRIDMGEHWPIIWRKSDWRKKVLLLFDRLLRKYNYRICKFTMPDINKRIRGKDWPANADTMIGLERLNNIQHCIEVILSEKITGDFIETGVWRGGAVIFMKAVLKANNVTDRTIWVADSFQGLPKPDPVKYDEDKDDTHYLYKFLNVPMEKVRHNFKKYGLLDDSVKFLAGWFKDTLPKAPIEKLALLRLDGDMYESTMDALVSLYPKVSTGGFIIVDDWNAVNACKTAVEDYRRINGITDDILPIDETGVYWRKSI